MRRLGFISRFGVVVALAFLAWTAGRFAGSRANAPVPESGKSVPIESSQSDAWAAIAAEHGVKQAVSASTHAATPLPDGPFGATIIELRRRADGGDAAAAAALAKGFRRCTHFTPSRNRQELEKHAEDRTVSQLAMYDQFARLAKDRGVDPAKIPEVDSMSAYRGTLSAESELDVACRGVDLSAARDWRSWQARAADLGDVEARLSRWSEILSQAQITPLDELVREKRAAAIDLQAVLAAGDWRALAAIASVLQAGMYAVPDSFSAHAYYFAAAQAPSGRLDELPWLRGNALETAADGNDTRMWLDLGLRATATGLTPEQRAAAERHGVELYRACCSGSAR